MSNFDQTLVLLKNKEKPLDFLLGFHQILVKNQLFLKTDYVVYNDTRLGEEKEPDEVKTHLVSDEIFLLNAINSWLGLGLLLYTHPDFKYEIGFNFLSWDDVHLYGFEVSFHGHEFGEVAAFQKHRNFFEQLKTWIDYRYIVGDVGNASKNYIAMNKDFDEICQFIDSNHFEIDFRN